MSEASFVATSAGVSPGSFPHSVIANAEQWPRPAQAWYAVFIFSHIRRLEVPLKNLSCGSLRVGR